jgi:hypothetical protein
VLEHAIANEERRSAAVTVCRCFTLRGA